MTNKDFFIFDSKLQQTTVQVHLDDGCDVISEEYRKPSTSFRLHLGIYEGINFPCIFRYRYGKVWRDVLDTGEVSFYVVSQKFIDVLDKYALKGWKTYPIKIYDKYNNEVKGYYGFSIVGRSGPVFFREDKKVWEKFIGAKGKEVSFMYYEGCYFDIETWDGSDFFLPKGELSVVVTKKVFEAIKQEKISNVVLTNCSSYRVHESVAISFEGKKRVVGKWEKYWERLV